MGDGLIELFHGLDHLKCSQAILISGVKMVKQDHQLLNKVDLVTAGSLLQHLPWPNSRIESRKFSLILDIVTLVFSKLNGSLEEKRLE